MQPDDIVGSEMRVIVNHHDISTTGGRSVDWFLENRNRFFPRDAKLLSGIFGIPEGEILKVREALKAMFELLTLFGCEKLESPAWLDQRLKLGFRSKAAKVVKLHHVNHKTEQVLFKFVSANGEGSWVKILKWKFAVLFAYYRNQDLPVRPDMEYGEDGGNQFFDPSVFIGGFCHDWMMSLRKKKPERFKQLIDTTQQLKKAMPEVPVSMVEKAERDTRIELTGIPRIHEETRVFFNGQQFVGWNQPLAHLDFIDVDKDTVVEALRRTVREIFDNEVLTRKDIFEPFFPSTSANYIWSRSKCGALSELYEKFNLGTVDNLGVEEFGQEMANLFERVSPHYGALGADEEVKIVKEKILLGFEPTEEVPVLLVDDSKIREEWKDLYRKIYEAALNERPLVQTVGLPEPLKVRVISKGPPLLYTCLKPFQAFLWRVLKKHHVFNLISRYVTEDDVNWILGDMREGEEAVSGDYVSSTNRLHSWVSEVILDQLMIEFGESIDLETIAMFPTGFMQNLRMLFQRALTKHIFVEDDIEYPQTEGQLMGSIISFPFLCIANAALCRLSLEKSEHKRFRLINRPYPGSGPIAPLMVNGDDCLLKGTKGRLRKCWEAYCGFAGLESSVGKTYFSDNFCTINSTIFEFNKDSLRWQERKYINLGLMMGKKRMGAGKNENFQPNMAAHELGTICRELKRSCPPDLWLTVKSRFIYYNKKELDKAIGIPWFLPEWVGGLGLPVDSINEIDDLNRRCATYIKMFMNKSGEKGRKMTPILPKEMASWLMHRKVMEGLRPYDYLGTPLFRQGMVRDELFSLEDEWASFYKLMTINLLFREPLDSLFKVVKKDKSVSKALKHNSDMFAYARQAVVELPHIEAMSDEDLLHENKKLVFPCFVKTGILDEVPSLRD